MTAPIRTEVARGTMEREGRVQGKAAIVTGAGSTPGPGVGTGKATAIGLAREGAKVMLVDIHPDRAEDTKRIIEEEGGTAAVFAADVRTASGCEAMVRATVDTFGRLDILVNNIGVASFSDVIDCSEEEWDQTFDVSLRTAFLASKYAVPAMVAQGGGVIVNVSSIVAFRGTGHLAYSAAKGGMQALTTDMAYSHGRQGVRVNAVAPGHIVTPLLYSTIGEGPETEFADNLRAESSLLGTHGTGWDVASAVIFLASDQARWIAGATLPVDGGVMSVTPLMMAERLRAVPSPAAGSR
jgi:NAD(P)-dependent dehydrogenase (short-subunit alcohol dehydrogenase family)